MIVEKSLFSDLVNDPGFESLFFEYCDECKMNGLPEPKMKFEFYYNMEKMGLISYLTLKNPWLVGFASLICNVLPHYSEKVAVTESLFVSKAHRNFGGGLKLIKAMEEHAKSVGCIGLLLSAPEGGSLVQVAPKIGYTHESNVFFKSLNESARCQQSENQSNKC